MNSDYDIFKAEILSENLSKFTTDVAVPKRECFNAAMIATESGVPIWVIRQEIVEKYFQKHQKTTNCEGGVVLGVIDENGKRIVSD